MCFNEEQIKTILPVAITNDNMLPQNHIVIYTTFSNVILKLMQVSFSQRQETAPDSLSIKLWKKN